MKAFTRSLLSSGIVLWATLSLSLYFLLHKPVMPAQSTALFAAFVDLAIAIGLTGLAGGFGHWMLKNLQPLSPQEQAALQLALGLGVLSLVVLLIGAMGILSSVVAWAGFLSGVFFLRKHILNWFAQIACAWQGWRAFAYLEKTAGGFVLFVFLLNLALALAPPLKWDSLAYHLELPKRYTTQAKVEFIPDNLYSGFPQTAEMWFTWAMALRRGFPSMPVSDPILAVAAQQDQIFTGEISHAGSTAALVGWGVGVVTMLGVGGFSRRINRGAGLWLAPAILLSGYSLSQALHWAYVDLWGMLYGLAAWMALEQYFSGGQRRWLALAGLFLGFSIGVKYSGGMYLLIAGLLLLAPRRQPWPGAKHGLDARYFSFSWFWQIGKEAAILGGLALLVVSPWLVKNIASTGQPLFPSVGPNFVVSPWLQPFASDPLPPRTIWNDLLLPLEVPLLGIEGAQIPGTPEYGASIGPLALALIPALLLGWRRIEREQKRTLGRFLMACIAGWWLWALLAHFASELIWPRHYYGFFSLLAVLAVAGYQSAGEFKLPGVRIQRLLGALVALALVLAGLFESWMWLQKDPAKAIFGLETAQGYLERNLGEHFYALQAVNRLTEDARVLFLWEPRAFYCQAACLMDGTLDTWRYLRLGHGDAARISQELCAHKISHVLFYRSGAEWMQKNPSLYSAADWQALDSLLEKHLTLVQQFGGAYELFALRGCSE